MMVRLQEILRYSILLFDDDPTYLTQLKCDIERLARENNGYEVDVFATSYSRDAMYYAKSNYVDVFVLDLCCRVPSTGHMDEFDYQGYELLRNLRSNYSSDSEAKFIAVSNLDRELIRTTIGDSSADLICKGQMNSNAIAQYIIGHINSLYKLHNAKSSIIKDESSNCTMIVMRDYVDNSETHIINNEKSNIQVNNEYSNLCDNVINTIKNDDELKYRVLAELEAIKKQLAKTSPHKRIIARSLDFMKGLTVSAEFATAIAALIDFLSK